MSSQPFRFEITIDSDTAYLATLRDMMGAFLRHAGDGRVSKGTSIACSMSLVEAVNNAIFHAHKNRRSIPIRIAMSHTDGRVVIDVIDRGGGIGELVGREPNLKSSGGRGLFIILQSMTRVTSVKRNGEHRLRMVREL